MGVDISSYRCRVGMFISQRGAGMTTMPFCIGFSLLIKILGSVSFVRILLIMAGIEQNPGPETFIFRYQYLLVHIGTDVLRKLFVVLAGNDIQKFLTAKSTDIKKLFKARVITSSQMQALSPVNNTLCIEDFDITLLTCLLKNICGLRPPRDPVWRNPAPTDLSLEADISRLRLCRNQFVHSDKLHLPDDELKVKWLELSRILTRLNKVAGIPNMQTLIDNAEHMRLDEKMDEEMSNRYNETVIEWEYMDRKVDHRIGELMIQVRDVELTEEILQYLIKFYTSHLKILPAWSLFKNNDEDLLYTYQPLTMLSIDKAMKKTKQIERYEEIFCMNDMSCQQIYITGDAGVGKTSFCKHLCFLWCKAKSDGELGSDQLYTKLWEDIDYISKFEYVFYINLRDTYHTHIFDMIMEQFFDSKEKYEIPIKFILRNKQCLILMDGLDEWSPKKIGRENHKIPVKVYSESCVYITTSRPIGISNVEFAHAKEIVHSIKITGDFTERFVENEIRSLNKINSSDLKLTDFKREIIICGLEDQLQIPMIMSLLVALWFEKKLTGMPRVVIFANILEMMFKTAEQREVEFPKSSESTLQLPGVLSGQKYLNKYVTLLYNVSHLTFRSMFKQNIVKNLVFTREQLKSEPYLFSFEEIDFLCKLGLFSTNVEKLKITFIHNSYVDFFAALFISSFDSSNLFTDVTKRWKCLNDVLPCENIFPFLAGFSYDVIKQLFATTFLKISDDLTLYRRYAIFHFDSYSYRNQIMSLQNCVIKCFKEVSRYSTKAYKGEASKMEDFIFDNNSDIGILREFLLLNATCVKSIHAVNGKYYPEFNEINCLQYLDIDEVSDDYEKFSEIMLQNESTLHTVGIEGCYNMLPDLPVTRLHHLTSLSLSRIIMQHNSLFDLVDFLSDNIFMENIKLFHVFCDNHKSDDSDCTMMLNLQNHLKLTSLCLNEVNISCNNFYNSSLKSIIFSPSSECIVSYIDVFNCIMYSQLENLHIIFSQDQCSDYNTMKTLTFTVNSLPCIQSLVLMNMKLPDDVLLELNPCVSQVKIELVNVTMSRQCFQHFIERFVMYKSELKVELESCNITSVDGVMSREKSMEYVSEYIESIPATNISDRGDGWLHFETRSSL